MCGKQTSDGKMPPPPRRPSQLAAPPAARLRKPRAARAVEYMYQHVDRDQVDTPELHSNTGVTVPAVSRRIADIDD
jgi:hypothetical protein